jgi:hypothetical protein
MVGSTTALGLALVICAEEMWECSVVVARCAASAGGTHARWSAPALPRHRS